MRSLGRGNAMERGERGIGAIKYSMKGGVVELKWIRNAGEWIR